VLPVSAGHSGLAEVSRTLAAAVPPEAAPLLSYPVDDAAVEAIASRLVAWLGAGEDLRELVGRRVARAVCRAQRGRGTATGRRGGEGQEHGRHRQSASAQRVHVSCPFVGDER